MPSAPPDIYPFPYTTLFRSLPPAKSSSQLDPHSGLSINFPVIMDWGRATGRFSLLRSEEHTSELQSRGHLVCRLLLEKKKKNTQNITEDPDHANSIKEQVIK